MCRIHQWEQISEQFTDALIVGNGGSMAVSQNFAYDNLYQYGLDNGFIDQRVQDIFDEFFGSSKPKDFERMLYRLWQADFVTEKLANRKVPEVRKAYLDVRLCGVSDSRTNRGV